MKKICLLVVGVVVSFALSSCGVYQEYQRQPLQIAKKSLKNGDCYTVGYMLDETIRDYKNRDKVKNLINENPKAQECYIKYIEGQFDTVVSMYGANQRLSKIRNARNYEIITTPQAEKLRASLKKKMIEGNKNGEIQIMLGSDFDEFPELRLPQNQKYMLMRTINALVSGRPEKTKKIKGVVEYLQNNNMPQEDVNSVKSALPDMKLNKDQLVYIKDIFPEYAAQREIETTAKVCFHIKNGDLLLKQDLLDLFKNKIKGVDWCDTVDEGVTELLVELVRNNERIFPEKTETISYRQGEVNILSAALLMPKNATYLYDLVSGGAEIEFGYVVKATLGEEKTHEGIVRGKVEDTYQYCQNARIRNVFGGVSPATFTANQDMQYRCSDSTHSVSIDDLRERVYARITDEVLKVPSIKKVHELY